MNIPLPPSGFSILRPFRAASLAAALLASPALLVNQASAVTYTWNGTTNNYWTAGTNWSGGVAPTQSNTTDLIWAGTTNVSNIVAGANTPLLIRSMTFSDTNDASTTLNLQNANATTTQSRSLTFSSDSGNATLTVAAGSTGNKLINRTTNNAPALFSDVNLTSSLDIVHDGSGTLTFGSQAIIKGAGGINKSGTGTLILDGANTYNGTTTISAGTLQLGNVNALQNTTLDTGTSGSQAVNFSVAGANTYNIGAIQGGDALDFGNNTISVGANNATTSFTGTLAGSGGSLTKAGTGTLTLSGASSSYDGTTTISAGTIQIDHANALGSGGNITFSGGGLKYGTGITEDLSSRIKNSGSAILVDTNGESVTWGTAVDSTNSGGLTKNGAGTLTLSGSSTYSGTTTISDGALRATHDNALGSTAAGTTVASGAALELSGGISIGAEALSLSGTGISSGGALRNISGNNSYAGAITLAAATLINSDSGNLTLSGIMSGSSALTKNGAGTLTLSATNTYTGGTTINGGTLAFTDNTTSAIGNGTITINNGSTLSLTKSRFESQSIIFGSSGGGNLTTSTANIRFTGSTITTTGGATNFISGNTWDIASPTFNVADGTDDVDLQVSNLLNRQGITKSGAGKLLLTNAGNNLQTNTITINAGALEIGATGRLLNGAGSWTGNMTNNGIFIYSGTSAQTLSGIISGSGALTQNAASTLTLSGNNTYSGTTTISDGTIEIGATGRLGAGSYAQNISNNGTLIYSGTTAQTLSGIISGTGALTKNAASTLTLSGANTYTGTTLVTAGTLLVNGSLAAGSAVTVDSGATLGGSGTINGAAVVNGNLRPGNSPGVLTFGSSLTLSATSAVTMELNGTVRGTDYDGIDVTGALTYGGALTINVGSAFLGSSETFSLFTSASQSSDFDSMSLEGAYGSGIFTNASGVWNLTDSSGNQWSFSQATGDLGFTAVPEPSTWALLAASGLILLFVSRRRMVRKK